MSTTSTYAVTGMTCEHCARAVREEIEQLDGVIAVDIDLAAGGSSRVAVTADTPLPLHQIRGAVEEAGYHLATAAS
ncbi:heavy-metal-associated domain-containing protein [Rhodococcus tibetensis]|uniref:Heavy-metal-associated domain-containing protein n=1 Tax=Rhodococcus tibetensis TaxID=2965064 RepID=A0ABT1QK50_9NOCA|nr:heavy-metal-associated domain-containing protein [Rhodococcus sp. FXJ9.536]MCQ4122669.1 heavy-metal-associated domain-containing protein [Rhodococcus sp. FXJ9.536]